MAFRPYDTRKRAQVEFHPNKPGEVRIYNCGPTVYKDQHIGNFRSFLFADLLRRFLEWRGYEVKQVMNITDVGHLTEDDAADAEGEDKLQKTAKEMGWDPFKVARHYEESFHRDRKRLGILDAHLYPRATDHVREMLALIQSLIERKHAYVTDGGEVYYALDTFPSYGELSGKNINDLLAGARVAVNEAKRHPLDFALWKVDPAHLMQWDPHDDELWRDFPGGKPAVDDRVRKGFPGWHIECSAMSMRYLGETFDIHTGGEDNVFPHHECEIAQSVGATGGEFARYWMHARHLHVEGDKMSKSKGILYRLDDLAKLGYADVVVRFAILSNHYRQPMNFSLEALDAARAGLRRVHNCYETLHKNAGDAMSLEAVPKGEAARIAARFKARFTEALDNDLNAPNAVAALFDFVSDANRLAPTGADSALLRDALLDVDRVLGIVMSREDPERNSVFLTREALAAMSAAPSDVESLLGKRPLTLDEAARLVALREAARARKDWAESDRIRDALNAAGVVIEDSREGVRVRLK